MSNEYYEELLLKIKSRYQRQQYIRLLIEGEIKENPSFSEHVMKSITAGMEAKVEELRDITLKANSVSLIMLSSLSESKMAKHPCLTKIQEYLIEYGLPNHPIVKLKNIGEMT